MFCASETFETLFFLGKSMDISERKQLICVDRVGFPELQKFCPSILLVSFKLPTTIHPQVISTSRWVLVAASPRPSGTSTWPCSGSALRRPQSSLGRQRRWRCWATQQGGTWLPGWVCSRGWRSPCFPRRCVGDPGVRKVS